MPSSPDAKNRTPTTEAKNLNQTHEDSPQDKKITPNKRIPGEVLQRSPTVSLTALYQSASKKANVLKREIKEFMDRVGKKKGVDFVRERLLEHHALTELFELYSKNWMARNADWDDMLNFDGTKETVPLKRKIELISSDSSGATSPRMKSPKHGSDVEECKPNEE